MSEQPERIWRDMVLAQAAELGLATPITIDRLSGGRSNPTYRLTGSDGGSLVLRTRPAGEDSPTAHSVDREVAVLRALDGTAVPAPRVRMWEPAPEVGEPFYLMRHIAGIAPEDPQLPDLEPAARAHAWLDATTALARLHAVPFETRGLADFGAPGDYGRRQVHRWSSRTAEGEAPAPLLELGNALAGDPPVQRRRSIIHGDYRFGNLMLDPATGAVRGILDWELSTLGDPWADLAYLTLPYVLPRTGAILPGLGDVHPAGVPPLAQLLAHYVMVAGVPLPSDWPRHRALALYRLAAISLGVLRREASPGPVAAADMAGIERLAAIGNTLLHPTSP